MKLAVILPHWKREEHRDIIVPYLDKFLSKRGYDYKIFVINQLAATPSEFNRGATKNIGFDIAKKEGYDYFAFHDIDMLPEDDSCDYSYPEKNPTHIAVKCSQFDYGLRYMEYFGGCVLFTKEQFEKVNGYSNGYWNWGMEDDDLFWRVKKCGMANETYMEEFESVTKNVLVFNGVDDYVKIKSSPSLKNFINKSFRIEVLVKAGSRDDIKPFMIGDSDRKYIDYCIVGRPGYNMGLFWNNSNTLSSLMWNHKNEMYYSWVKRYPDEWTHLALEVDTDDKKIRLYLNGKESDMRYGTGTESPIEYEGFLKRYGGNPYYIGVANIEDSYVSTQLEENYFNGKISDIKFINHEDEVVLHYDFTKIDDTTLIDNSEFENHGEIHGCDVEEVTIKHIKNITLPYRKEGKFKSLYHRPNNMVNDQWVHKEDTGKNEQRFITEVQKDKVDISKDGLSNLDYTIIEREFLHKDHEFITVSLNFSK